MKTSDWSKWEDSVVRLTLSANDFLATNRLLDSLLTAGNFRNIAKITDSLVAILSGITVIDEKISILVHDLVDIITRYQKTLLVSLYKFTSLFGLVN